MDIIIKNINEIINYDKNARIHSNEQLAQIVESIKNFGFNDPIEVDANNIIISGHARLAAAKLLNMKEIPVIVHSHLKDNSKEAYILAANKIAINSSWDLAILKDRLESLDHDDQLLAGFNEDELNELLSDEEPININYESLGKLSDRFLIHPFSIFDARQGYWQDRKRAWIGIGIKSEEGRDAECLPKTIGRPFGREELTATSVFDPVLCEIIYRWFTSEHAIVLDPFAGGSVRGIVAGLCNRQYIGIDLSPQQIEANRRQWTEIEIKNSYNPSIQPIPPVWHIGDSLFIKKLCTGVEADLIFSCPPYGDLEVYSDNPQDISTLNYPDFIKAYREIIANSCSLLKENRFACFVVGDIRDKKGIYQNFVSDTIQSFLDAGLKLYNEAILITPGGTLSIRAGNIFSKSRKLAKGHQNVLIFIKGDPKLATEFCGIVEVGKLEDESV